MAEKLTVHMMLTLLIVFLLYEVFITYDLEVEYFWSGPITGARVLFFTNRYLSLLFNTIYMITYAHFPEQAQGVTQSLLYIPWAAFSAIRAYVLCKSKVVAAVILVLALVPAGVNLAPLGFGIFGATDTMYGCLLLPNITSGMSLQISLIVADTALVLITGWSPHCRDVLLNLRRAKYWSLSTILLRNGPLMLVLNVVHLVFSVEAIFGSGNDSFLITFTNPLTSMLASRFLFQLQAAHQRTIKVDSHHVLHLGDDLNTSRPAFALRLVGSLGSVINAGEGENHAASPQAVDSDAMRRGGGDQGEGESGEGALMTV
ncbi:hypothetical protein C8Q76DRAFT_716047 [Earliella scabrosa]|nr:hypothetical protein C8Q76DRAFT_716047 [Earliella scabrosa]